MQWNYGDILKCFFTVNVHHFISKATVYTVENTQMNFLLKKKTNLLGKKKFKIHY